MTSRLAIYAPNIGALSETFIRRHMQDLLPGQTAVIAQSVHPDNAWTVTSPRLVLSEAVGAPSLASRLLRNAGRLVGRSSGDPNWDAVRSLLRTQRVEVMLGEYLDASLRWIDLAEGERIRFYGRAHGYDISQRLRDAHWRRAYLGYRRAHGIISVSEIGRQRLVRLGLSPSKVHAVPCGVDVPDEFPARAATSWVRCLAVGRMVAKKAPILTLEAFRRALDSYPELRLDYVGAGELLPAARQFVHAFGLEGSIALHGALPPKAVMALMGEADIFIQHSVVDFDTGDEEGIPVSILQAMAAGMPVVSTLHSGIPEAVVDGETGFLVAEGDVSEMAAQIATLAHSPPTRDRMGREAWARARDHFSWARERRDMLEIMGLDR